ncbi:GntR family transcriptional regulator [Iodidimonas nitroreducens]|uniref:GntR family transcriptional regulator n=1 Tax=Iodidimonas nitroreducens TaxID=1236968 RepID=A0A5A7N9N5_9PROT|nr:GntR family transcriptional regulator [Iodidimonas nitroreducens]GAK33397.1 exu regulon transcriptional regulator [alpha proteobacterium Q-1]GER04637.1 GntR family transcriptional regulator [Iodidimonas nitroreducens]
MNGDPKATKSLGRAARKSVPQNPVNMAGTKPNIKEAEDPSERVYRDIAKAVLEQRLQPGTKLGEQLLCEIFNVNRPVIRRALMRLSYETLVEIRPHRGAFVASPTPLDARQIFEARRALEDWVVRICAERIDPNALQSLTQHVAIEQEARLSDDRVRWIRLSGQFHLELAAATGNSRIQRYLEDLIAQTSLIISLYGGAERVACEDNDHSEIVAAIARADADHAISLMRAHLAACEAGLSFEEKGHATDLRAIFPVSGKR